MTELFHDYRWRFHNLLFLNCNLKMLMKTTVSEKSFVTCHIGHCFAEQAFASERLPVQNFRFWGIILWDFVQLVLIMSMHMVCSIRYVAYPYQKKIRGPSNWLGTLFSNISRLCQKFYIKIPDSVEINWSGCLCVISTVNAVTAFKHADNLTISSTNFDSL